MTTRRKGMKPWVLFGILPLVISSSALGQQVLVAYDCNSNAIEDACDLDCNLTECQRNNGSVLVNIPGCGMSQDCDTDGIPDECDDPINPQPRTIYYVDADATGGTNTSVDWSNAYVDLKFALDTICGNLATCDGNTASFEIVEVWVAEGWYYPSDGTGQSPREKTIRLCDNVRVYGGFDPGLGAGTWQGQRA